MINALTSNLNRFTPLDESIDPQLSMNDFQTNPNLNLSLFMQIPMQQNRNSIEISLNQIYSILIRSSLLLFKFYGKNPKLSRIITNSHGHLTGYIESNENMNSRTDFSRGTKSMWTKLSKRVIIQHKARLNNELNGNALKFENDNDTNLLAFANSLTIIRVSS